MLKPHPNSFGFAFAHGDNSHEVQSVALHANANRIPRLFFSSVDDVPPDWIPVGSVEWCESVLGRVVTPDYYPPFLAPHLRRRVWTATQRPRDTDVFLKPADRHKRFTGGMVSPDSLLEHSGPFWCSDVVSFRNEWRYYVQRGRVVAAHWYSGDNDKTPAPPTIDVPWPSGWSGAVDFGELSDGSIALVEAHPPFAVGWYGTLSEHAIFASWITTGWHWLIEQEAGNPKHE